MTQRAERVYLSFFEYSDSNQHCIANMLRQVVEELMPINIRETLTYTAWTREILNLADELEDPLLLENIYGDLNDI